jgi:hypothetical protein
MTTGQRRRPARPNRPTLGPDTVRACYRAHTSSNHQGAMSTTCRTCRNYLLGISRAATRAECHARQAARDAQP